MLLPSEHNAMNDKILVLKVKPGKTPVSTMGLLDNRLFKNENNLHAVMDEATCLWFLKYDSGIIPEGLKGKFTSFPKLLNFTRGYFDKRNVDIVNVID